MDERRSPARGVLFHLALASYWFSFNYHWGALLNVVIPFDVLRFVPEAAKGRFLGLALSLGAFVAMVVQPVAGTLSDGFGSRWGRRRPFLLAGALGTAAGLLLMAGAPAFAVFVGAYGLVQLASNVSVAGYQGLMPDVVAEEERGRAAGYRGLMTALGSLTGIGLASWALNSGGRTAFYWSIAAVLFGGALLTAWRVREEPSARRRFSFPDFRRGFWVDPRHNPDFGWVFLTRFLVYLGFYTIMNFMLYYLRDAVVPQPVLLPGLGRLNYLAVQTVVGAAVLLGTAAASVAAGNLSDRIGRKPLVSASAAAMALGAVVLILRPPLPLVLGVGFLFGIAFGTYLSGEWALATDCLPSAGEAGRYLGLWGIAMTLPQVIGPLLGGSILDRVARAAPGLGYAALFGTAMLYLGAGALVVWRVRRGGRPAAASGGERCGRAGTGSGG
ncbi:MAG: MFS transporter [Bacillota bacterium]|nr:MFS transporter [Bacillota bacterium]